MRFYDHLYTGEQAGRRRHQILSRLREGKFQPGAYVITPASGGNNLLDIYHASELLKPFYKSQDLLIVGIAWGYREACELAGQVVAEVYRKTGSFDVKGFLQ